MKWITRARPKIDRVACPWLIMRYIDPSPEFLFVPPTEVLATAARLKAIPFDVPGVELTHDGANCSFDAFLAKYRLRGVDPALADLADIVRAADTGHPERSPPAAGLVALSLGLSAMFGDDHEMLRHGVLLYDALLAWLKQARDESHGWPPAEWIAATPVI